MLLFLSYVTFILSFIWQTLQTQIEFSNPNDPLHYAEQVCTNVQEHQCCVPIDLLINGQQRTGFRAQWIDYTRIPPGNFILQAWRYGRNVPGTTCGELLAAMTSSYGKSKWSYKISIPKPGLSGGWYYEMTGIDNATDALPPTDVVWPDLIRYDSLEYTDGKRGDLFYREPTGKFIIGEQILGLWNILNEIWRQESF